MKLTILIYDFSQILMNVEQTPTTVIIVVLTHLDHSTVPVTLGSPRTVMVTPAVVSWSQLHCFRECDREDIILQLNKNMRL